MEVRTCETGDALGSGHKASAPGVFLLDGDFVLLSLTKPGLGSVRVYAGDPKAWDDGLVYLPAEIAQAWVEAATAFLQEVK